MLHFSDISNFYAYMGELWNIMPEVIQLLTVATFALFLLLVFFRWLNR